MAVEINQSKVNDSFIQIQAIERFRPDPDRLYDVDMAQALSWPQPVALPTAKAVGTYDSKLPIKKTKA